MLAKMDFSYIAGDLRKDIHSSVRLKPSEYWQRQCYLGSSIFSRAEIRARRSIGIDKMMLGFDYPHFEGAWRLGVRDYIQATLGEQEVSEDEAQLMLSKTAAEVFRFDVDELRSVADRIGPEPESVLTPSAVPLAGVSAGASTAHSRPSLTDLEIAESSSASPSAPSPAPSAPSASAPTSPRQPATCSPS